MARSSCSAGGRCKCLSEVNLKISSHSLSDFRNELKWSPSYSSFTRYICNHGEYNYLRSKRTCRRQSHMLRVLSHYMSRYWFILSGKKKKISLTLFWWPCGLTRLTTLEGTTGQKHITLLWPCASPSAYERNVHRMTEQQSCLPAAQTQRGHWICSCAKFKSEEVVLSMQTWYPTLVWLRQEDSELKATVRTCLIKSKSQQQKKKAILTPLYFPE